MILARVAVVALLLVAAGASLAAASPPTVPDRESSYPDEVDNVTHAPWVPRRGDDVRVTLRLVDGAAAPASVSLLYCRVEPTYVCGLPFQLQGEDADGGWTGTIAWNPRCRGGDAEPGCEFMLKDTVHVGYNLTLRYEDGRRVSAPTGNHWVPPTYPSDSDGVYYFLRYEGTAVQTTPAAAWGLLLVALASSAAFRRR